METLVLVRYVDVKSEWCMYKYGYECYMISKWSGWRAVEENFDGLHD